RLANHPLEDHSVGSKTRGLGYRLDGDDNEPEAGGLVRDGARVVERSWGEALYRIAGPRRGVVQINPVELPAPVGPARAEDQVAPQLRVREPGDRANDVLWPDAAALALPGECLLACGGEECGQRFIRDRPALA